jgi:WD40 repeat protein
MNPQNKELRTVCLDNSKRILSCLLPMYSMISFHQGSQRLAVGAIDGKVYIYDLTTGSIWKNLNAHNNEVSALNFDFTGNILITYSGTEACIKFWKVNFFFFNNFIFSFV